MLVQQVPSLSLRHAPCTFVFLLRYLVPLKQTRAVRRMAKDTFVLIHVIVVAWFSCFFEEMSSARLEWYP